MFKDYKPKVFYPHGKFHIFFSLFSIYFAMSVSYLSVATPPHSENERNGSFW